MKKKIWKQVISARTVTNFSAFPLKDTIKKLSWRLPLRICLMLYNVILLSLLTLDSVNIFNGLKRKTRTLHFYSKYLKTQVIYLKKSRNTIQVMNSRRRILPTRLSRRNTRQLVKTDDIQGNKVKILCFLNPQTLEKTLKFLVVRSSFHVQA